MIIECPYCKGNMILGENHCFNPECRPLRFMYKKIDLHLGDKNPTEKPRKPAKILKRKKRKTTNSKHLDKKRKKTGVVLATIAISTYVKDMQVEIIDGFHKGKTGFVWACHPSMRRLEVIVRTGITSSKVMLCDDEVQPLQKPKPSSKAETTYKEQNRRAFDSARNTYFGGKAGNGVYHLHINNIPRHKYFVSLFAGHCAITRKMRPSQTTVVNDQDIEVRNWWKQYRKESNQEIAITKFDAIKALSIDWIKYFPMCPLTRDTMIYLDPPYLFDVRKRPETCGYKHELTNEQHEEMLQNIVETFEARVNMLICGVPHPMYNHYLDKWYRIDYTEFTRGGPMKAAIWFNYPKPQVLHDFRFLGNNFTHRQNIKRKANNTLNKLMRLPIPERMAIISLIAESFDENGYPIKK